MTVSIPLGFLFGAIFCVQTQVEKTRIDLPEKMPHYGADELMLLGSIDGNYPQDRISTRNIGGQPRFRITHQSDSIAYFLSSDTSYYTSEDTIFWKFELINLTHRRLRFMSACGIQNTFELIDARGRFVDGFACIDTTAWFSIPPGDTLVETWQTDIGFLAEFVKISGGKYYGIARPDIYATSYPPDTVEIYIDILTDVAMFHRIRFDAFHLRPLYPNPFNTTIHIEFELSFVSDVDLTIFNVFGQKVKSLISCRLDPGYYRVYWDGTDDMSQLVGSGMYVLHLKTSTFRTLRKMILLR
jgi:hypothetical protein